MHRTARAYARKRFAEDVFGGVAVCPLPYVKTVIDDLFKIFRVRSVLESGPETDERRDSGVAVFVAERLHVKTESAGDVTVNIVLRNDAVGVRERQCAEKQYEYRQQCAHGIEARRDLLYQSYEEACGD